MRTKQKTNQTNLIVVVLLSVALVAGLVLVNSTQDSRRGAFFAGTDLILNPDKETRAVNQTFPVQIYVNSGNVGSGDQKAKIDYVKAYLCYEDGVGIEAANPGDISDRVRVGEKFSSVLIARVEPEGANTETQRNCANIEIKAEKPRDQLGEGTVLVGTVEFKALKAGRWVIDIVKDKSMVTGYNPDPTNVDAYLEIGQVSGMEVNVEQATTKWLKSNDCDTTTGNWSCSPSDEGTFSSEAECQAAPNCNIGEAGYVRSGCNQQVGQYYCQPVSSGAEYATEAECVAPDANCVRVTKWTHSTAQAACNTATGAWTCVQSANGEFDTREGCEADVGCDVASVKFSQGACNTATGKYICTQGTSGGYSTLAECEVGDNQCRQITGWPVLNYRITYAGVKNNNECATNWPVTITVRKGDVVKTYSHTPTSEATAVGGLRSYKGSLALTDFGERENVAVFIKGPRHVQVKYGQDGQDSYYNLPGGQVNLTADSNSPVYDFTAYPVMACDIVGKNSSGPDGICNGLDYSVVKSAALARSSVPKDSNALSTDMDGDCQMSSADLSLLAQTLKERQDQQY